MYDLHENQENAPEVFSPTIRSRLLQNLDPFLIEQFFWLVPKTIPHDTKKNHNSQQLTNDKNEIKKNVKIVPCKKGR